MTTPYGTQEQLDHLVAMYGSRRQNAISNQQQQAYGGMLNGMFNYLPRTGLSAAMAKVGETGNKIEFKKTSIQKLREEIKAWHGDLRG